MKTLEIKYTVSKARDTYGYNVVTLWDGVIKYKAMGGGYDMLGTVFGEWLWVNYKALIIETIAPKEKEFYGFKSWGEDAEKSYNIDGACGLDCMLRIANAIGLQVSRYRKASTDIFTITTKTES